MSNKIGKLWIVSKDKMDNKNKREYNEKMNNNSKRVDNNKIIVFSFRLVNPISTFELKFFTPTPLGGGSRKMNNHQVASNM